MDNHLKYSRKWKNSLTAGVLLALALGGTGYAMPAGGQIQSGQGAIAQNGKTMTVTQQSGKMAVDWTQFNIARDEAVKFAQPGRDAVALNRITGGQKSVIDGALSANGNLLLVNPNGVVFSKTATVDVGSLVASTAQLNDTFMKNFAGSTANLNLTIGDGNTSAILNEGTITAQGGLVALHAAQVENTGTISNPGGTVALAAAKQLTLSPDSDGKLNYAVDGELAQAKALNSGRIQADGGYVVMTAKSAQDLLGTVVNNTGTLEAKTLRKDEKGQILLDGGKSGQVEVSGTLDASGTEEGQSAGSIKVIGQKTIVHDNTNLIAQGNVDGGKIETSGDVLNLGDGLTIDASGVKGKHGEWLLDPLEILIQDEQPLQAAGDQSLPTVNGGKETQITYNDPPSATQNADATYSSTTWIKTSKITDILNAGTDVTIQAASTSQAASITVNSAIKPKVKEDREATLTLEAQRNVTINKEIAADKDGGKLNVKLNSDTDGDGVGAVIINADISTNGGFFTSGSGGTVTIKVPNGTANGAYADTGLEGKANIAGHTVGTYFGYVVPEGKSAIDLSGEQNNRKITTNGGAITLDGEVAIGLNGGVLTLDTSKKDGSPVGNVNITGIVNSGNSYDTYIYGTEKWNQLVEKLVQEYLDHNSVPSYRFVGINYTKKNADGTYSYTTEAKSFEQGESHYAFHELKPGDVNGTNWTYKDSESTLDTQHTRWYATTTAGTGYNSFIMEGTTPETSQMSINEWLIYYRRTEPENYAVKYANGNTNAKTNLVTYDTIKNDATKMETLKSDISALIAHNWFASEKLAQSGTGANPGDSYLATITTALENSLSTPNSQKTLWVGGMGSGVRNKTNDKNTNPYSQYPADPSHQDGFYWVTGPEGLVTNENGTKGTKFWDTSKSYWNKDLKKSNYGEQVYGYTKWSSWSGGGQPDNSAPFLTVGYGNNNAWDDAAIDGGTTVGFVQETNLYNSSLDIKTAGGKVTLQGDIGKSVGLDTVKIDAGNGDVITGNKSNTATKYNHGTIYADHGVYINGKDVTVGGEIHSGGTNVEATRNADASFKEYLDNVTIQSSGNLTVHGIEVNASTDSKGNTTSRTDVEGGKISLTSTGTEGVITLGDGVDYNGKNTNGGVLKAASTANDAVVIDAQGKKSKFVNETSSPKAIDTQGKWKIYSASPEQNTFGKNLNSGKDAQWTSNSTKFAANGSDENKFIFQTTPTITLYVEDKVKTYGDDVTKQLPDYMMNREEFTGVDGKLHNVNEFTDAFQEKECTNYISVPEGQSITVTSVGENGADGAVGTATRTGGTHAATEKSGSDGKNAVYDLNVNLNGATAKDGYVLKNENATLEIVKRKASITGTGTQTYGDTDGTIKNWKDTQTNIADGSTVSYTTSIKSDSDYTKNKGSRNTADHGTYSDSVSFKDLKITDANENEVIIADNYDLTTTGTIDVAKAKLTVNTDGKTTTYGTVDENYKSSLDKTTQALNSDKEDDILKELGLTYTLDPKDSAYIDSDNDGKYDKTNHVKYKSDGTYDSYKLDVANTNTLKNYDVTVKDSTVTLERANATVDTEKVTTDYGKVDTGYTSHFNTAVNGDNADDLLKQLDLSYSTDAYTDDDTHTNNVKDGGYDLNVQANGSLTYHDYDVTVNNSTVTLKKVNLTVNPEDIHRIYGQATEVQEDAKTAYNLSGFANGDTKDTTDKEGKTIDQLVTVTNDVSKALKDNGTHTQNASADGYDMETTASGDLTNYNIVIGDLKKVYLDKAELVIDTDSNSKVYGNWQGVKTDIEGAAHIRNAETAVVNGDKVSDLVQEMGLTTSSDALQQNPDGTYKTNHVKDGGYAIDTKFADAITNYTVKRGAAGTETLIKAQATVDTDNVTTTYGTVDKNYTSHFNTAVNGDNGDELLTQLKLSYSTDAYDKDGKPTNDVKEGGYDLLVTAKGSLDHDDYDVTVKNANVTLNKATLVIDTTGGSKDYGDVTGVKADLDKSASFHVKDSDKKTVNGDDADKIRDALNISVKSDALVDNGTRTNDVKDGGYEIKADYTSELQNYKVETGTVGREQLNRVDLYVDSNDLTKFYGDAQGVLDGLDSKKRNTLTGLVNGDEKKEDSIRTDIGIKNSSPAVYTKDGKSYTKDVGDYEIQTALTHQTITNYNVKTRNAGKVTLTPVAITVDNEMIQTYGSADRSFKEIATPPLVNGDTISTAGLTMAPKAGGKYETNKGNRTTADYGFYEDDLAFSGGGIVHADGTTDASKNYKVTIKGGIIVNKADLTVTTKDVTTPFGTVKFTTSGVQGLTNGDEKNVSDLKFNYGSYGNAYLDNNSYTNAPGRYEFTTETTNQYLDFLNNYNILGGDAAVTITPVDKPVKPDITPDRPNPVPEGKGEVEEPSMDDFRGEEEHRDGGRTWYREKKSIPFFKVLDGKVTNYGTFDVESMPEKVEITPSGMRLPEPDQPETQHREYTTTLTLPGGDGSYRLVYNGVSFNIHAVDTAARQLLEAGDPKKNEELSEAALHTGFQKMGLGLEDLKAVYVRFN
ncbi:two-partner secretion domain-containing protein [Acidaminococcus fermentans]|uniref:two-partner secretion domain-containing protein n=1 Tax=Acidaminococcus fermentans TaxID=905 RepID=UPI003F8C0AE0